MAFERLRVKRSPGLVWLGAALAVLAFAGAQASAHGAFWRPTRMGEIGYGYLALTLVGAYCIACGLYGEWWRVVRVDLAARKVKTSQGRIVGFDELDTLEVRGNVLETGTRTVLFVSSAADVQHVKVLLESLVHGDARRRLYRMRRLAYHRLPALLALATIGFAALVGVAIAESHTLGRELSYEPEYKLMWLLGFILCASWLRRALFGSFTSSQLHVDPVAGLLQLADGTLVSFGELGALSIRERRERSPGPRYIFTNHDLHAANLAAALYTHDTRAHTQRRLDALATAVLQWELRRALEAPAVEGDAFRSGPDPRAEAARLAGDSPHAPAALRALARDADPTVRERAAALLHARGDRGHT